MYHGPYIGTVAEKQPKRILILGESHHDIPPTMTTQQVVDGYLEGKHVQFFQNIAKSFGIYAERAEEKVLFWDKLFFGNYIDISLDGPSGEGDQTAKKLIADHKGRYNLDLADFVNRHQINTIFCFGLTTVFDHLPGNHYAGILPSGDGSVIADKKLGKNGKLEIAGYLCEPSPETYDHPVRIYGMTHPSDHWHGFSPEPFVEYLKPVFEDYCK